MEIMAMPVVVVPEDLELAQPCLSLPELLTPLRLEQAEQHKTLVTTPCLAPSHLPVAVRAEMVAKTHRGEAAALAAPAVAMGIL